MANSQHEASTSPTAASRHSECSEAERRISTLANAHHEAVPSPTAPSRHSECSAAERRISTMANAQHEASSFPTAACRHSECSEAERRISTIRFSSKSAVATAGGSVADSSHSFGMLRMTAAGSFLRNSKNHSFGM